MTQVDSLSSPLAEYVGHVNLRLSQGWVGMDNDSQNLHFMFVALLTTMKD